MTNIIGEKSYNVAGKKPHDMGIRQGVDFTLAIAKRDSEPDKDVLLVGIIDTTGRETAIPMEKEAAHRVATAMLEYAEKMR